MLNWKICRFPYRRRDRSDDTWATGKQGAIIPEAVPRYKSARVKLVLAYVPSGWSLIWKFPALVFPVGRFWLYSVDEKREGQIKEPVCKIVGLYSFDENGCEIIETSSC